MAVNPHAETYQGSTRFSGPVKAGRTGMGNARNPGTLAVSALPNLGNVVCSQSCAVQQAAGEVDAVDIVLPAYSMIISIQCIATVAWETTNTFGVRVTDDTGGFQSLTVLVAQGAMGVYNLVPATAAMALRWQNVNDTAGVGDGDVSIAVESGAGAGVAGRGILTINYIPGLNL